MKKLLALLVSIFVLGSTMQMSAGYDMGGATECASCPKKRACPSCPKRTRRCNRCPRTKRCVTCPRSGETEQMEENEADVAEDRRSTVID